MVQKGRYGNMKYLPQLISHLVVSNIEMKDERGTVINKNACVINVFVKKLRLIFRMTLIKLTHNSHSLSHFEATEGCQASVYSVLSD